MFSKSIKVIATLFAIIISMSLTLAQDLINLIPKDAFFLGVVDLNQIKSKANFDELIKLPIMEEMNKKITSNYFMSDSILSSKNHLNFEDYGISATSKAYFYVKGSKEIIYGAFVFAIDNDIKFSHFAKTLIKDEEKTIKSTGKYKYIEEDEIKIVWNSKSAAIFGASVTPMFRDSLNKSLREEYDENNYKPAIEEALVEEYQGQDTTESYITDETIIEEPDTVASYEDFITEDNTNTDSTSTYNYDYNYSDNYMDVYNRSSAICDSIEISWCKTNAELIIQDKGNNSLIQKTEFTEYMKSNPDGACMFDYNELNKLMTSLVSSFMYSFSASSLTLLNDFYTGTQIFGKIEFNQDDIKLNFDMKYGDKMAEIYKDLKKTKISNKFLKYLDNELMAYIALGVDIEAVSRSYVNMLRQYFPLENTYGKVFPAAIDVLDIFIDEQSIYNIFTGDIVVSLNGIKPVEVPHITYDYDENYNMSEKLDTSIQMQPEVLCMLGIGNVNDVNKILKLFISLEVLKQEGNLYSISYHNNDLPVYLSIYDNILFISNNKSYVEHPVVYPKNKQLSKEHVKMFSQNALVSYANISKIAQHYALQGHSEEEKIYTNASSVFSSIKMLGKNTKVNSSSSCVLELSKTTDNSIVDIIKFLNKLYISKSTRFD